MKKLQTLGRDEQAVLAALERDGGAIVEDYIDAHLVAEVRDDFLRAIDAYRVVKAGRRES